MDTITFLRKREETHLKARTLGATAGDIARFEQIALALGPRTTLSNSGVYDAIWFVGLHSLMDARPLIPTNAAQWAGEVWLHLWHTQGLRVWDVGPMIEIKQAALALWSAS